MSEINILEHKLVPKHEIMSSSEVKKEFENTDFEISNLPKISINDPVVKAIGAKPNNILRITRNSQTAGTFVTYRIVEE